MSRELILSMSVSMDAFVAGPNGEFDWVFRNSTAESRDWLAAQLDTVSLHAMGRASYQAMVDYWPTAEGPFAPAMNTIPKVVFSRSTEFAKPGMEQSRQAVSESRIEESVLDSWLNPTVKGQDLATDINELKSHGEGVINALGGASFAASLIEAGLVDVFRLVVHPVVLGSGMSIFKGLTRPLDLMLEDLKRFDSGIVVKTLRPRNSQ